MRTLDDFNNQILATLETPTGKQTVAQIVQHLQLSQEEAKKRAYAVIKKNFLARLTKAERNQPCPCMSGLKFKKCCVELRRTLERRNRYHA